MIDPTRLGKNPTDFLLKKNNQNKVALIPFLKRKIYQPKLIFLARDSTPESSFKL